MQITNFSYASAACCRFSGRFPRISPNRKDKCQFAVFKQPRCSVLQLKKVVFNHKNSTSEFYHDCYE